MVSAAKQIKVRGADLSGVELTVQPLSSLTGRVVLEVFTETLVSAKNASDTLERIQTMSSIHGDNRFMSFHSCVTALFRFPSRQRPRSFEEYRGRFRNLSCRSCL